MDKRLQIQANKEVLETVDRYNEEMKHCTIGGGKRLRTCQAYVYETPSFYVLRSYNTVVAIIKKVPTLATTFSDMFTDTLSHPHITFQSLIKTMDVVCGGCKERVTYRVV